jgi:protein disulfide-isomerase
LFKAYLTDGQNINDIETLTNLGIQVGLDGLEIETVLHSDTYATAVKEDIEMAQKHRCSGVPLFSIINKNLALNTWKHSENIRWGRFESNLHY